MNDHSYINDPPRGGTAPGITATGFIVGALFGAGVALLLAPAPGGETRKKLGETARRLGSAASDAVNRGREQLAGSRHDSGGQDGEATRTGGRQQREPVGGGRTPLST